VHIYNFKVSQGQKVTQGQLLAEIAPKSANGGYSPHLHIGLQPEYDLMDYMDRGITFRTKYQEIKNIWFNGETLNWGLFKDLSYNDNTMSYKIGDVIEFTGTQNIRQGSGTSYPSTGSTQIGQTATIINGPRTSDNYTWWDVKITGGGTGWLADVGKWKIYVEPPQEPTTPPALVECQNKVKDLESDIVAKNKQISTLTKNLEVSEAEVKGLNKLVKRLEGETEELNKEKGKLQDDYDKVKEERDRLEKEKLELEEQLSKGTLAKASTGEIFAELWNRITRSIK
jgi:hypothetical protein